MNNGLALNLPLLGDRNIVVADLDGCCVDPAHRIHFYLSGDMEGYHAAAHLDKPIYQGVLLYQMLLVMPGLDFVFVTARQERARSYTLPWLREYISPKIRNDQLLMRPNHLFRKEKSDADLKPELIQASGRQLEKIFLAFDDNQSVVDRWRSLGITCYQPAVANH